jgi:hypothetical protein
VLEQEFLGIHRYGGRDMEQVADLFQVGPQSTLALATGFHL